MTIDGSINAGKIRLSAEQVRVVREQVRLDQDLRVVVAQVTGRSANGISTKDLDSLREKLGALHIGAASNLPGIKKPDDIKYKNMPELLAAIERGRVRPGDKVTFTNLTKARAELNRRATNIPEPAVGVIKIARVPTSNPVDTLVMTVDITTVQGKVELTVSKTSEFQTAKLSSRVYKEGEQRGVEYTSLEAFKNAVLSSELTVGTPIKIVYKNEDSQEARITEILPDAKHFGSDSPAVVKFVTQYADRYIYENSFSSAQNNYEIAKIVVL